MMHTPPRTRGKTMIRARLSPFSRALTLPLQRFLYAEQAGGVMLIIGAVIGLVWANSPWVDSYHHLMERVLTVDLHVLVLSFSLHHWINDGLMTLFFLAVGLEIKREMVHGSLATVRQAALPVLAALGGMILPAILYFLFTAGTPSVHGWGVPVATDIAFALGILSLLGDRVPTSAKIFLLAFATVDDIGGILIIALFYSGAISWTAILACLLLVIITLLCRKLRIRDPGIYGVLGVLLWLAMLKSGIHAAIAGVVLGLLSPARGFIGREEFAESAAGMIKRLRGSLAKGDEPEARAILGEVEELARNTEEPLEWLDRLVRPWVSYLVLPIFALANSGVELTGEQIRQAAGSPVTLGIFVGLLAGKLVGVGGASWLAVKVGAGVMPPGMGRRELVGVSLLAGIGFTVSLFITNLAFTDEVHIADGKIGILAASAVAAVAGYLFLRLAPRRT